MYVWVSLVGGDKILGPLDALRKAFEASKPEPPHPSDVLKMHRKRLPPTRERRSKPWTFNRPVTPREPLGEEVYRCGENEHILVSPEGVRIVTIK